MLTDPSCQESQIDEYPVVISVFVVYLVGIGRVFLEIRKFRIKSYKLRTSHPAQAITTGLDGESHSDLTQIQ